MDILKKGLKSVLGSGVVRISERACETRARAHAAPVRPGADVITEVIAPRGTCLALTLAARAHPTAEQEEVGRR